MTGSEARGLPCAHCGGVFPVATLVAVVGCPYCGREQRLDSQTFQQLHDYRLDVQRQLNRARADQTLVDSWQRWTRPRGHSKTTTIVVLALVAVPTLLGVVGSMAIHTAARQGRVVPFSPELVSFSVLGLAVCGVVAYYIWYFAGARSAKAGRAPPEVMRVACPNCGAPNTLNPGQALETCQHCRAALIPSNTVIHRGLAHAEQVARRAEMEKYRTERLGMLSYGNSTGMARLVPYLIGGMATVPTFLAGLSLAVASALRGRFDLVSLPMCGVGLAGFGVMAMIYRWRQGQQQGWRQALDDLARQFNGRTSTNMVDEVEWLNRYWVAPYDPRNLVKGFYYHAGQLLVSGFPALLHVNPKPIADQDGYEPRIHALLACWVPGLSDRGQRPPLAGHAEQMVRWLYSQGFEVTFHRAGIECSATRATVRQLRKNPTSLHGLAPVLMTLSRLAEGVGGTPVEALA